MDFGMEVGIFLAYAGGLLLIYILGKVLIVPLKWTGKLLINSVIGAIIIILVDLLGSGIGIFVPLNPFTAILIGLLGVPGALFLLALFNL